MAMGKPLWLNGALLTFAYAWGAWWEPAPGEILWYVLVPPLIFLLLFFAIPFGRIVRNWLMNESGRRHNLRRLVYSTVAANPAAIAAEEISTELRDEKPIDGTKLARTYLDELCASYSCVVSEDERGRTTYGFVEIEREMADLRSLRANLDHSTFHIGRVIFDSGVDTGG